MPAMHQRDFPCSFLPLYLSLRESLLPSTLHNSRPSAASLFSSHFVQSTVAVSGRLILADHRLLQRSESEMAAATRLSDRQTERSPLISKPNGERNGHVAGNSEPDEPSGSVDEVVLAEEPSTTKLALTMGTIWIGVFFAALGTEESPPPI